MTGYANNLLFDGQHLPKLRENDRFKYAGEEVTATDQRLQAFYSTDLDRNFKDAYREIMEMRAIGKLRPFVEGEPIGALPRRVRTKTMTPAAIRKTYNSWRDDKQKAMLALRAKNDTVLGSD